ncbi:hypothetical protein EW145_g3935 [Phellinidium pouzarii]|uniref:Uncharacterized protein n=1 Tax=Phellinidium pouzarii TaxID=167371 RepID=A0A4S4L5D3_9AGAM|nr:hypothetical protein EW145_g3935 [Phellinidium pouzarii]
MIALQPSPEPPSVSLLISVLIGLPLALWTYKCLVMVALQRKIIYMGYIPPGTRSEKLEGITLRSGDLSYEEIQISSANGVKLSALIMGGKNLTRPDCVMVYLQGNAGNPLHRIPVFTELLKSCKSVSPVVIAAAPRSYWSSSRRTPTQRGMITDYQHVLRFATRRWPESPLVLYGHSLGGAVAVCLLASLSGKSRPDSNAGAIQYPNSESGVYSGMNANLARNSVSEETRGKEDAGYNLKMEESIRGLILENPFSSVPGMVHALYPQRWLPYRFLAPLAWDKWDALGAMRAASSPSINRDSVHNDTEDAKSAWSEANSRSRSRFETTLQRVAKDMLVVVSGRDEIVPRKMGRALYEVRPCGGSAKFVVIEDALHEDAWRQRQWVKEISRYLKRVSNQEKER